MALFHALRRLGRRFGIEAQWANIHTVDEIRLAHFLNLAAIDAVLDVGANAGQFALALREAGYRKSIVSFEPLPDAHAALAAVSRSDPLWSIAPAMALSDAEGRAPFHVAGNSVSSSLRPMAQLHADAGPGSAVSGEIDVATHRLDNVLGGLGLAGKRLFLKLDVQGAEDLVLKGAEGAMPDIAGIKIEMSVDTLYRGQMLMPDQFRSLEAAGFVCWDIAPGARDMRNGRMLQCDGIFFRPSAIITS